MALTAQTVQFINQLGLLTFVDPSTGGDGPEGTTVYKLVPKSCWYGGSPFPKDVQDDLKAGSYDIFVNEGLEYWMVPDETSTNVPGAISFYARTTRVDDLVNPPGGGINTAAATIGDVSHIKGDSEAVSKYVKSNDNRELALNQEVDLNARIKRQVGADVPTKSVKDSEVNDTPASDAETDPRFAPVTDKDGNKVEAGSGYEVAPVDRGEIHQAGDKTERAPAEEQGGINSKLPVDLTGDETSLLTNTKMNNTSNMPSEPVEVEQVDEDTSSKSDDSDDGKATSKRRNNK